MPKRMIHSEIFDSDLMELKLVDRWLFIGLVVEAGDDQGRFAVNDRQFMRRFFYDDGVTRESIRESLDRLAKNESIALYVVDGVEYGQILHWWQYQSLQWAKPSDYPPPEGWGDKIRYHASGADNVILTLNWERNDGGKLPDTCDCRGRPKMEMPPPKKEGPPGDEELTAAGPQSSTGEHRTQQDITTPPLGNQGGVGGGVATPQGSSVVDEVGTGIRSKDLEDLRSTTLGSKGGRDLDPTRGAKPEKDRPPLWMPTNADRLSLNRSEKNYLDGLKRQVQGLGLEMAAFRLLVNHVLDQHGKLAISQLETADGVQALRKAQECVLALLVTDKVAYATIEGIDTVYASWQENDWRAPSLPNLSQLVEHAGLMTKGLVVNEKDSRNSKANGANARGNPGADRVSKGNQSGLGREYTGEELDRVRARVHARQAVQYFS